MKMFLLTSSLHLECQSQHSFFKRVAFSFRNRQIKVSLPLSANARAFTGGFALWSYRDTVRLNPVSMLIGIWWECNRISPNIFMYKLIKCYLSIFMSNTYNYLEISFGNFPLLGYFPWKFSFLHWPFDPTLLWDSKNWHSAFLLASKHVKYAALCNYG